MTYVVSAIVGGIISICGIVVGNVAIGKMMDAYDESIAKDREMFSTGEVAFPGNKRKLAGKWYRSTHVHGSLTKMLRIGQSLTVAGFPVAVALLAI